MSMIAKMRLTELSDTAYGPKKVRFDCQYDNTITEDKSFAKATPNGHVEMYIDNPAVFPQLTLGEYYYVTFEATDHA